MLLWVIKQLWMRHEKAYDFYVLLFTMTPKKYACIKKASIVCCKKYKYFNLQLEQSKSRHIAKLI